MLAELERTLLYGILNFLSEVKTKMIIGITRREGSGYQIYTLLVNSALLMVVHTSAIDVPV